MNDLIFYANGSSGNHGCEALTRSLFKVFSGNSNCRFASFNVDDDKKYIGSKDFSFFPIKKNINKYSWDYLLYYIKQHISKNDYNYYKYIYSDFIGKINKNAIYCSIGGDNYSYGFNNWLFYLNSNINKRNAKTILLGCSILDEISSADLISDLSLYSKIICRESITYRAVKKLNINKNVFLLPDPAFQLNRVDLKLPNGFVEGNTVGINVSPMIIEYEKSKGMTLQNYIKLIDFIIQETDMQIALIPHVVWNQNDDRVPLRLLYSKFKTTGRVCCIEDCNAEVLKGYIARCRFMVAARTHASIAAYSQCVPTLVVGYSVKARGIAKDLFGTEDNYVIPVQSLINQDDLKNAFLFFLKEERRIRNYMNSYIPEYREKVWKINEIINR